MTTPVSPKTPAFAALSSLKEQKEAAEAMDLLSAISAITDQTNADTKAAHAEAKKVENGGPIAPLRHSVDTLLTDTLSMGAKLGSLEAKLASLKATTRGAAHQAVISMWSVIAELQSLNAAISSKLLTAQNVFAAFAASAGSKAAQTMNEQLQKIVQEIDDLTGGPNGTVSSDNSGTVTKKQMQYNTLQTQLTKPVTDFSSMQQMFTQLNQNTVSDISQFLQMIKDAISTIGQAMDTAARGR